MEVCSEADAAKLTRYRFDVFVGCFEEILDVDNPSRLGDGWSRLRSRFVFLQAELRGEIPTRGGFSQLRHIQG